jgi:hypothetical protein
MSVLTTLYRSRPLVTCFEGEAGEEGEHGPTAPGGTAKPATPPAGGGAGSGTFTQDDLNRFLAEDRRKAEAKHQATLAQYEARLTEALNDKTMTEDTRKALEENLEAVRGQLRTKEQQLAHEKKQLEDAHSAEVIDLKKKVNFWESLYKDSTVERALQDAAVRNEAFNSSQIVVLLKPNTKLLEVVDETTGKTTGTYKPMVEMDDVDPKTGDPVKMVRTPEEAVKRMKELPETYGNLFKTNVVSGIGAGGAPNPGLGSGRVDVRKLTPQQYRELREKNPEALGLRRKR